MVFTHNFKSNEHYYNMYILNRIGIARYNRIHYKEGNGNRCLGYCKNRGLIYAITLIGHIYVTNPKKSAYKNGIIYLQQKLNEEDNLPNISKSEIKTAMRPYLKRKHLLKIPVEMEQIVVKTIDIIHATPDLYQECKAMNHAYANLNNVEHLECYHFLIGPLIWHLDIIHGAIVNNSPIRNLYNILCGNHRLCK